MVSGLGKQPIFFGFMTDLYLLTEQAVAGLGVELVDVERAPKGLLRVTIDRPEGVRIEDCELVSRQLSRVYEVEDIDYWRLEVGSPGVDRPLKTEADFVRFAGERIELKLRMPIESRKVFTGVLSLQDQVTEGDETDQGAKFGLRYHDDRGDDRMLEFTFAEVDRAKLDPILDFKGKKR